MALNFDYFANVEAIPNNLLINSYNKNSNHPLGKQAELAYN